MKPSKEAVERAVRAITKAVCKYYDENPSVITSPPASLIAEAALTAAMEKGGGVIISCHMQPTPQKDAYRAGTFGLVELED